jgi:hypothetical protein
MYNSNDPALVYSRPSSLSEKDFKEDIEEIVVNGAYHSDEVSETDEEKAQEEISQKIRPKNKGESDKYVIHVYDKPWRSKKVFRKISLITIHFILFVTLYSI